ncbi:MAG: PEP-utilizing enzyme [bacterium]|nr:PEP-utilizing enzyme [bacterium]
MKLVLLGVWDTTPGDSWHWFTLKMTVYFRKLTGFRVRQIVIREKGLNKEAFEYNDTEKLRKFFDSLSQKKKTGFVNTIVIDYSAQSAKAEKFISRLEKFNLAKLDDAAIICILKEWCELLPSITFQIWFGVILDVWYPDPQTHAGFKRRLGKARDKSGKLNDRIYDFAWKLYKKVARRYQIPLQHFMNITTPELIDILEKRKSVTKKECIDRTRLSILTHSAGKDVILTGKAAKTFVDKVSFVNQVGYQSSELKGIVASPGKVRGRVRKIFYNNEFSQFQPDEILVTYQTMVHFLPLMKKSKAIVTEFGGLTSHAAIVSRELKKPCIVGVKGLTTSLQDGDMVEVDASLGTVKKLP